MAVGRLMTPPGQLSLDMAAPASTPHVEAEKDKVARRREGEKQYRKACKRGEQGSEVVEKTLGEPVGKTCQVASAGTWEWATAGDEHGPVNSKKLKDLGLIIECSPPCARPSECNQQLTDTSPMAVAAATLSPHPKCWQKVTPVDDDIEEEDLLPHAKWSRPKWLTSAGPAIMATTAVFLLPKHWQEAIPVDDRIEEEDLSDDQWQQASGGQATKGAVKEPDALSTDSEESREEKPHPKRQCHAIQLDNKDNNLPCEKCWLSAEVCFRQKGGQEACYRRGKGKNRCEWKKGVMLTIGKWHIKGRDTCACGQGHRPRSQRSQSHWVSFQWWLNWKTSWKVQSRLRSDSLLPLTPNLKYWHKQTDITGKVPHPPGHRQWPRESGKVRGSPIKMLYCLIHPSSCWVQEHHALGCCWCWQKSSWWLCGSAWRTGPSLAR